MLRWRPKAFLNGPISRSKFRFGLPVERKHTTPSAKAHHAERRSRQRFRIGLIVWYRCLSQSRAHGTGRIVDISSKGVRFTTDDALPCGTRIELSVDWPAKLNETSALQLTLYGNVMRSEASAAAMCIEQYEFRTRGVHPRPISSERQQLPSSRQASRGSKTD